MSTAVVQLNVSIINRVHLYSAAVASYAARRERPWPNEITNLFGTPETPKVENCIAEIIDFVTPFPGLQLSKSSLIEHGDYGDGRGQ